MRDFSDEPLRPDAVAQPTSENLAARGDKYLPLEAQVEEGPDNYVVRLSLKKEEVTAAKQTFVAEVVTIRRITIQDSERIHDDTLRSEELRTEVEGDVEAVRERDVPLAPEARDSQHP